MQSPFIYNYCVIVRTSITKSLRKHKDYYEILCCFGSKLYFHVALCLLYISLLLNASKNRLHQKWKGLLLLGFALLRQELVTVPRLTVNFWALQPQSSQWQDYKHVPPSLSSGWILRTTYHQISWQIMGCLRLIYSPSKMGFAFKIVTLKYPQKLGNTLFRRILLYSDNQMSRS